jgi:acetoin utilization protein AcuB
MNLLAPVSTIMTTKLITLTPDDKVEKAKEIFEAHPIHHLPVVRYKQIVGMVSKSDLLSFIHGFSTAQDGKYMENVRLKAWKVEDIMTKRLAKVEVTDSIRTVLDVFLLNKFHALPVMDGEDLAGIVTTHDIIKLWSAQPVSLADYSTK